MRRRYALLTTKCTALIRRSASSFWNPRDNWYEICAKRYASDPDRLDEIKNFLQKTATAEDLQKLREELTPRVVEIRASRMREFYEELEKGGIILTEDVVQLEDFFHCYSKTLTAVVNTRRRRKIRLFARLLTNSLKGAGVRDPEDYEFLLGVLDDLSLEDLAILKCIEEYEKVYYKNGQFDDNQGQRSSEGRLLELVRKRLGLTDAELGDQDLAGMVVRLNRSGCYLGLGWREGPAHDCRLTGIYYKLKRLILKEGEALGIARAQRP